MDCKGSGSISAGNGGNNNGGFGGGSGGGGDFKDFKKNLNKSYLFM